VNLNKLITHAAAIGVTIEHPERVTDLQAKAAHAKTYTAPTRPDLGTILIDTPIKDWDKAVAKWMAQGETPTNIRNELNWITSKAIETYIKENTDEYFNQITDTLNTHVNNLHNVAHVIEDISDYRTAVELGHSDELLKATKACTALDAYRSLVADLTGISSIGAILTPPDNLQPRPYVSGKIDRRFLNLHPADALATWEHARAIDKQTRPDWLELARDTHGIRINPATTADSIRARADDWNHRLTEYAVADVAHAEALLEKAQPQAGW
jgi:hypothetical protein